MADSVEGRTLGAYRMGAQVGAGGIGAVYEATHVRTGRPYAVKVLLPESTLEPNALQRFRREAEALAALGHASIVAIHDFDVTEDGIAFLVMDRLHGEDLSSRLERGPLALDETLRIFDEIAEALGTAHQAGILHRDLKPSNVFLARRPGAAERAVLLDFGLAKMMEGGDAARLTASGATMGTPMYMSPEQAQGLDVDACTDVYSLAAILFEMITGSPPFTGPTVTAILSKVLTHPPPPLRSIEPSAPAELEPVIRRALAKGPDERPSTVRRFQTQVHRAVTGVAATTPQTQRARPLPKTMQTPRQVAPMTPGGIAAAPSQGPTAPTRWIALSVGLLGGLAIVAWILLTRDPEPEQPPPIAPTEVAHSPTELTPEPEPDAATEDAAPEVPPTETPPVEATMHASMRPSAMQSVMATRQSEATPSAAQLGTARTSADQAMVRTRAKITEYQRVLPGIADLRRNLGEWRNRPPICDRRSGLDPMRRVGELGSSVSLITRQIERTCDLFDAWASPEPAVQSRIDRLGERFARARHDLQRRREEDLSPADREALIREIDALERAIGASRRFPCGAREHANLMRQAAEIGPRGAQPALEAGRAFNHVCNAMRHSQLPTAHRQLGDLLDRTEATVHQLIGTQQEILQGLESARARYGD